LTWGFSPYIVPIGTGWVVFYSIITFTTRAAIRPTEILCRYTPPRALGIRILIGIIRIGSGVPTVEAIPVIASITVSWKIIRIPETKSKKWIVKAHTPIGSAKAPIEERVIIPKGVVKGIVKAPVVIKITPRVVIYVINFCFGGVISPRGLRIYAKIAGTIVTAVIFSVGICIVLRIVR
tara:strand:- start:280 stop:816 length:537 start_codon:yes stop_codon:yes gene_type:complete